MPPWHGRTRPAYFRSIQKYNFILSRLAPGVGASLSREGGAHMRIGEAYTFVPAAFGAEIGGKDTKTIPRRVTGHIEYINRAHRYFTVRVDTGRGILRESFKF